MKRLLAVMLFVGVAALCSGCLPAQGVGAPPVDPAAPYRPALQTWAQEDAVERGLHDSIPRYTIEAALDGRAETLTGYVTLTVPLTFTIRAPDLAFRLYPNLPKYGGQMEITGATVDGREVAGEPSEDGSVYRLAASDVGTSTIRLDFTLRIPRSTSDYVLFGWGGDVLSLPGFYPVLAARGPDGWALDFPTDFSDVLFGESAWYELLLSAPSDLAVISTGHVVGVTENGDGTRTWRVVAGPVRDLTLAAGHGFESRSTRAAGATVTSYYPPEHKAAGEAALWHAAAALRFYSDYFGPYPYADYVVVAAPLNVHGMEYCGMTFAGVDLYDANKQKMEFLLAHEVGHQWWYCQVGSDPLRYPWLDEGLTEYSTYAYFKRVHGVKQADSLLQDRWRVPYLAGRNTGLDRKIDMPVWEFSDADYELLVYAKGALFFHELESMLGEELYRESLRVYLEDNRYGVATPQRLIVTMQTVSGRDLNPVASEWLAD